MLTWYGEALGKGIASETTDATANRTVVAYATNGISATCVFYAGIDALLIEASFVSGTL